MTGCCAPVAFIEKYILKPEVSYSNLEQKVWATVQTSHSIPGAQEKFTLTVARNNDVSTKRDSARNPHVVIRAARNFPGCTTSHFLPWKNIIKTLSSNRDFFFCFLFRRLSFNLSLRKNYLLKSPLVQDEYYYYKYHINKCIIKLKHLQLRELV